MSVTMEARIHSVTLRELQDELGKLCFAGFGESTVDFSTPSPGFCNTVTVRIFKPAAGDPYGVDVEPKTPAKKTAAKKVT